MLRDSSPRGRLGFIYTPSQPPQVALPSAGPPLGASLRFTGGLAEVGGAFLPGVVCRGFGGVLYSASPSPYLSQDRVYVAAVVSCLLASWRMAKRFLLTPSEVLLDI